jgi:hypothetical protein
LRPDLASPSAADERVTPTRSVDLELEWRDPRERPGEAIARRRRSATLGVHRRSPPAYAAAARTCGPPSQHVMVRRARRPRGAVTATRRAAAAARAVGRASERPVLVLGTFDGVHGGHRALIARAVGSLSGCSARGSRWPSSHPPRRCSPASVPQRASAEKHELLPRPARKPAPPRRDRDRRVRRRRRRHACRGVRRALAGVDPSAVVVGEDFRFGRGRRGGIDMLRRHRRPPRGAAAGGASATRWSSPR